MAQNFPLSPPHTPIPIGSHQRDVHVFTALYSCIIITRNLWAQTSASKVSSSLNKKKTQAAQTQHTATAARAQHEAQHLP